MYREALNGWKVPVMRIPDRLNRFAQYGVQLFGIFGYMLPDDYAELQSMKILAILGMLDSAEAEGLLDEDTTLIEATSGNSGNAVKTAAKERGLKNPPWLVLNRDVPEGKRKPLDVGGAHIIYPDPGKTAIATARERGGGGYQKDGTWKKSDDNFLNLDQYANPANARYYRRIVPGILEQVPDLSAVCVPVGTGGSIIGLDDGFREHSEHVRMVAVQCAPGHEIPGVRDLARMGEILLPWQDAYDTRVEVEQKPAYLAALWLYRLKDWGTGPSGGLTLVGADRFLDKLVKEGRLDERLRRGRDGKISVGVVFHDGIRPYFDRFDANLPLSDVRYEDADTMPLPWEI